MEEVTINDNGGISLEEEAQKLDATETPSTEVTNTNTEQLEVKTNELTPDESLTNNTNSEEKVEDDNTNSEEKVEDEPSLQEDIQNHSKAVKSLEKSLKEKGVDFSQAVKEYNETGALSGDTIKALADAGYPKEVVQSFIEGRRAIEERFTNAVYDSIGGKKEFDKIVSWASSNLPKKSIDTFNRAVDNNNLDAIELMLEGMKSKMIAKQGTTNRSIYGSNVPTQRGTKGYADKDEIIKAMSDKRYGRDAKYTHEVELKMWATQF